eukprot:g4011.t1
MQMQAPGGGASAPASFFEVVMVVRMDESLRPALQYAVSVLVEQWPRFAWLAMRFNEVYAAGMLLLQSYYLRNFDSLVAEYFYGFRRRRHGADAAPLSPRGRAAALAGAVLLPYLLQKAHEWHESEAGPLTPLGVRRPPAREVAPPPAGAVGRALRRATAAARDMALCAYPLWFSAHELARFAAQAAFLVGRSPFHTPVDWLTRQKLCRLTPQDLEALAQATTRSRQRALERIRSTSRSRLAASLRHFALRVLWLGLDWGKYALVGAVLAFKGFEWWFGAQVQAQRPQAAALVPPPPLPLLPHRECLHLPPAAGLCPLTGESLRNPAASASGYVFSYAALHEYVQQNRHCPITRVPMSVDDIRTLFVA